MPLWLHTVIRALLPLPFAIGIVALYTWGCVAVLDDTRFKGWGWVVFGCVLLGIAIAILGWLSPRWLMRKFPVRCELCGGSARMQARLCSDRLIYHCTCCKAKLVSPWEVSRFVSGLVCAGMGLAAMILVFVTAWQHPGQATKAEVIAGASIGLVFFILGMSLAGGVPLWNWLVRKMPWVERVPWGQLIGGGAAFGVGVGFICLGLFSRDSSNMPEGRGPVVIAGFTFALAGIAVLLQLLSTVCGRRYHRIAYRIATGIGLGLLGCFAAVPAMIALNNWRRGQFELGPILSAGTIVVLIVVIILVLRARKKKEA